MGSRAEARAAGVAGGSQGKEWAGDTGGYGRRNSEEGVWEEAAWEGVLGTEWGGLGRCFWEEGALGGCFGKTLWEGVLGRCFRMA